MNKENLVVMLENADGIATMGGDPFVPNVYYRCLPDENGYLINGYHINKRDYELNFETVHARIMRDWKHLGLVLADGDIISKTSFSKFLDFHKYGRGRGAFYSAYLQWKPVEDNAWTSIYQFNSSFMDGNKKLFTDDIYNTYVAIVSGAMEAADSAHELLCFGQGGVPIGYKIVKPRPAYVNQ